jgi:hypothetical protein
MPNWCSNELTIVGKPKMLNKLLKQITTTQSEAGDEATPFDFDKVVPQPSNLGEGWYDWRVSNWGTKWNASDVMFLNDGDWSDSYDDTCWESGELTIMFNTAWSPPIPILTQLSQDNPKVTITHKFTEEGMAFYGTYEYSNGDVDVVKEGSFDKGTSCEIYREYYGDSYHHSCDQCGEWFDCDGEPQDLCVECEKELLDTDKELWGEVNETIAKETQSVA